MFYLPINCILLMASFIFCINCMKYVKIIHKSVFFSCSIELPISNDVFNISHGSFSPSFTSLVVLVWFG